MWLFEATYENMDCDSFIKCIKRKIEFDGDNFSILEMNAICMLCKKH